MGTVKPKRPMSRSQSNSNSRPGLDEQYPTLRVFHVISADMRRSKRDGTTTFQQLGGSGGVIVRALSWHADSPGSRPA